ncbi:MAG: hypothetical protein KKD44_27650 [Proteobacteria bacterium]|nr:hypothetical protein [Pseudomonadota bacterium]
MEIMINDIQLIRKVGGYVYVYIAVTATEGDKVLTEEFMIGRRLSGNRVVTDVRGWLKRKSDGVYVNPKTLVGKPEPEWEREPVLFDLQAMIMDVVTKTFNRKFKGEIKQDRPELLKKAIQRGIPVWADSRELPLSTTQLKGTMVEI